MKKFFFYLTNIAMILVLSISLMISSNYIVDATQMLHEDEVNLILDQMVEGKPGDTVEVGITFEAKENKGVDTVRLKIEYDPKLKCKTKNKAYACCTVEDGFCMIKDSSAYEYTIHEYATEIAPSFLFTIPLDAKPGTVYDIVWSEPESYEYYFFDTHYNLKNYDCKFINGSIVVLNPDGILPEKNSKVTSTSSFTTEPANTSKPTIAPNTTTPSTTVKPTEFTLTIDPMNDELPIRMSLNSEDLPLLEPYLPKKTGYKLDGLYTSKDNGEKVINSDGTWADSIYYVNGKFKVDNDLFLYAHWIPEQFTVSFYMKNETATLLLETKTIAINDKYGELPTLDLAGYAFKGWFTEDGHEITSTTIFNECKNVSLCGKWKKIELVATETPKSKTPELVNYSAVLNNDEQYQIIADQEELKYKSNNLDVAVVSSKGLITAIGEGNAIISVINMSGDVAQFNVTVKSVQRLSLGDFNYDGKVDITDLSVLSIYLADKKQLSNAQSKAADVTGDGVVDLSDLAHFRSYLSKRVDWLGTPIVEDVISDNVSPSETPPSDIAEITKDNEIVKTIVDKIKISDIFDEEYEKSGGFEYIQLKRNTLVKHKNRYYYFYYSNIPGVYDQRYYIILSIDEAYNVDIFKMWRAGLEDYCLILYDNYLYFMRNSNVFKGSNIYLRDNIEVYSLIDKSFSMTYDLKQLRKSMGRALDKNPEEVSVHFLFVSPAQNGSMILSVAEENNGTSFEKYNNRKLFLVKFDGTEEIIGNDYLPKWVHSIGEYLGKGGLENQEWSNFSGMFELCYIKENTVVLQYSENEKVRRLITIDTNDVSKFDTAYFSYYFKSDGYIKWPTVNEILNNLNGYMGCIFFKNHYDYAIPMAVGPIPYNPSNKLNTNYSSTYDWRDYRSSNYYTTCQYKKDSNYIDPITSEIIYPSEYVDLWEFTRKEFIHSYLDDIYDTTEGIIKIDNNTGEKKLLYAWDEYPNYELQ